MTQLLKHQRTIDFVHLSSADQIDSRKDMILLGVAVCAVCCSAVLVRWADTSPIALAFWRTAAGSLILAATAVIRSLSKPRPTHSKRPLGRSWLVVLVAGIALAAHFMTWLTSLGQTTVAASVTLVTTTPLFIAAALWVFPKLRGGNQPATMRTWLAIGLALVGVGLIASSDSGSSGEDQALLGDALALAGALSMAVYLLCGQVLRTVMSTVEYASRTYGIAAIAIFGFGWIAEVEFFDLKSSTWVAIAALVVGPQLLGHTVINYILGRLGSLRVSIALLVEPVGASLLVWLAYTEVPKLGTWIGAPLILLAIAGHLLSTREVT